jgi:ATP-binding cassette, subfamily C, bacteriocin exporter
MRTVKQYTRSDCAAACLVHVARHYGLEISTAMARRLAGTTRSGTTALGLVQAAEQLGLTAKGVRAAPASLDSCPLPAIAHVKMPSGRHHYLVVLARRPGRLRVLDPADGTKSWHTLEAFQLIWGGVLVLLAPGRAFAPGSRTTAPLTRLLGMLAGHKAAILQIVLGAVLLSALGLTMSFYVQRLIDDVIPDANRPLLGLLGIAMLVLILSRLVVGWFQFRFSAKLSQRIDSTLVLGYYRHLLSLPQSFFDTMRIGEMTSRISDAVQIRSFLSSVMVSAVLNPVILLSCFCGMFFFSGKLALLTLTQIPLQLATYLLLNRLNRKYQRQIKERAADLNSHVTEVLHTVSTVKRFGLEPVAAAGTEKHFVRLLRTIWTAGLEGYACSSLSSLGSQVYSLGMLWFGTTLVLRAELTPGELMSCYTLAMYVSGSLGALVGLSSDLQQALISTDRLFEIMDEPAEPEGGSVTLTPELLGPISFDRVTLRHAGRLPVLREVSLVVPLGRITAVTGESGSGKSTLLALLQRLYLPESGLIQIGTLDFEHISTASLRALLSVLPQRIELSSGSILSNIAVGETAPDLVRVTAVCRQLGILEFINSLPQKFHTSLNEGGLSLSGGQRQRIALARTFYRPAPLILLDEPTLGLDRRATRCVMEMMKEARARGATVIAVTHSGAIIGIADSLLVFKDGRIGPPGSKAAAAPGPEPLTLPPQTLAALAPAI